VRCDGCCGWSSRGVRWRCLPRKHNNLRLHQDFTGKAAVQYRQGYKDTSLVGTDLYELRQSTRFEQFCKLYAAFRTTPRTKHESTHPLPELPICHTATATATARDLACTAHSRNSLSKVQSFGCFGRPT